MENIFIKWLESLQKVLGDKAVWAVFILISLFLVFLMYERFNKAMASSSSNKFKKYELFLKVFDSDLTKKSPIIIEQGFSNYFGFSLSCEEIQYCCNLTKPTEFINDLKKCKNSVEYCNGKYNACKYIKINKFLYSLFYWLFALVVLISFYFLTETKDYTWNFPIIVFACLAGYMLTFVGAVFAAERISGDFYKQRVKESCIVLPQ